MAPNRRMHSPRAAEMRAWPASAATAAAESHPQSLSTASAPSLAAQYRNSRRGRSSKSRRSDGALRERSGSRTTVRNSSSVHNCAMNADSRNNSGCASALASNSDNSSSCALSGSGNAPKAVPNYKSTSRENSSPRDLSAGEASNSSEQKRSSSVSRKKQRSCSSDMSMRTSSSLEKYICASPALSTSTSLGSSFSSPALTVACNPCSPSLPSTRSVSDKAVALLLLTEAPSALPASEVSTSPLASAATTAMKLLSGPSPIFSSVLPLLTSEKGTAASSLELAAAATPESTGHKAAATASEASAVVAAVTEKTALIARQSVAQADAPELASGVVSPGWNKGHRPAPFVTVDNLNATRATNSAVGDIRTKRAASTGGATSSTDAKAAAWVTKATAENTVRKQQQRKRGRRVARGSSDETELENRSRCNRETAKAAVEMPVSKAVDCSLEVATLSRNSSSQQRARGSVGENEQTSQILRWCEAAAAQRAATTPAINLSMVFSAATGSAASNIQIRSWTALHKERGTGSMQGLQQHRQRKPVCFTPNLLKSATTSPTWLPFSLHRPTSAVTTVNNAASPGDSQGATAPVLLTASSNGAADGNAADVGHGGAEVSVRPHTLRTDVAADTSTAAADAAHDDAGAVTGKTLACIAAGETAAARRETTYQKKSEETIVSSNPARVMRRDVQFSQMLTNATAGAADAAAVIDASWKSEHSSSTFAGSEPAGADGAAVRAKTLVIDPTALDEAATAAGVREEERGRLRRCSIHSRNMRPCPLQLPFHLLEKDGCSSTAAALCAADSKGYFERHSSSSSRLFCKGSCSFFEEKEELKASSSTEETREGATVAVEKNVRARAPQLDVSAAAGTTGGTALRSACCPRFCEAFDSFVVLQLPRHLPSLDTEAMMRAQHEQHQKQKQGAQEVDDPSVVVAGSSAARRKRTATAKKTPAKKAPAKGPSSSRKRTTFLLDTSLEETQTPSVHTQKAGALRELPDGYLGKLLLFKSGRVLLRIGGGSSRSAGGGAPTASKDPLLVPEQQAQPHAPTTLKQNEQQPRSPFISESSNRFSLTEKSRNVDDSLFTPSSTRDAEPRTGKQMTKMEQQGMPQQKHLHQSAEIKLKRFRGNDQSHTEESPFNQVERTLPATTTTVPSIAAVAAARESASKQQEQREWTSEQNSCCACCSCLQTTNVVERLHDQPQKPKQQQQQQRQRQQSRQNQRMPHQQVQEKRECADEKDTYYFTVEKGSDFMFRQDCGMLLGGHKNREFVFLGRCAQRFKVAPDISSLFENFSSTNTNNCFNSSRRSSSREHADFCKRQPTGRW